MEHAAQTAQHWVIGIISGSSQHSKYVIILAIWFYEYNQKMFAIKD